MKRTGVLLFAIFAVLFAGTVNQTVDIKPDQVALRRSGNYDVVELTSGFFIPNPGKPLLPYTSLTLLIPADARVTAVSAQPVATEQLPGSFTIFPAPSPVPISAQTPAAFVAPDPEIYSSNNPFPNRTLFSHSTGSAAGFKLVNVIICPFEYHPATQKLFLHTRIEVVVFYEEHGSTPLTLTQSQRDRIRLSLRQLISNPTDLNRFAPPLKEIDQPAVDYLIITSAELSSSFTPYIQYKTSRGLKTELRTVEWVANNYPGRDLPEKIRNLIIDYFHSRGLSYVLLAGDNLQVPTRRIEVSVGNEQGSIPTDLYYGDLDYSWDSNHNNRFGEMADSVDLYADVFVGRASVDSRQQVENFIAKVQAFENNPAPDYIMKSLLPSGWLWRSLNYHGKFVNDSIAEITPPDWTDRKMENPPSALVVADSFDRGFLIFNPAGHGNESGVYDEDGTAIYTNSVASRQQNDRRFSIITSLACNPGNFEAEDCLAEVALNCQAGGAIAVMMNSRYGWGTPPVMGPSEKLCVRFYDFLFNYAQYQIGPCHDRSREEYAGAAIYDPLWRWCMTEFNLLGDPTIDIWTAPPHNLVLITPDTIRTGPQTFTATVHEGGNPAAGATVTVSKDSVLLATGTTNSRGIVSLPIHPTTTGQILITTWRHNNLPNSKTVFVEPGDPEPYIVYHRYELDDHGQPYENGVLEPGETAFLKIVLKNIGSAAATNTHLTLRTLNPNISILDSIASIGTIPAGDSIRADNLTVAAEPSTLPGSSADMVVLIRSDQGEFELWFTIELGYPGRTAAEIDTGICGLTVTARGTFGYDPELNRKGRGFRYPESDTSRLNIASFALGNSSDYLVDRFYNQTRGGLDQDWHLQDSLRLLLPIWGGAEVLFSSFNDQGHPNRRGIVVDQRALGFSQPELNRSIALVFDIWNTSGDTLHNLYAGILADFDVRATDRLHDVAFTLPEQNAALMYNVSSPFPCVGIKLLYPRTPANLTCIDHSRYVYPDSGLTDGMKFRALTGNLGVQSSDRPYNWSLGVATGPFNIPGLNGRQKVAFAFIAGDDSLNFLSSCAAIQNWFDTSVGFEEGTKSLILPFSLSLSLQPNLITSHASISYSLPRSTPVNISILDITGRKVATLFNHKNHPAGTYRIRWQPRKLVPGVYFLKLQTVDSSITQRCLILK